MVIILKTVNYSRKNHQKLHPLWVPALPIPKSLPVRISSWSNKPKIHFPLKRSANLPIKFNRLHIQVSTFKMLRQVATTLSARLCLLQLSILNCRQPLRGQIVFRRMSRRRHNHRPSKSRNIAILLYRQWARWGKVRKYSKTLWLFLFSSPRRAIYGSNKTCCFQATTKRLQRWKWKRRTFCSAGKATASESSAIWHEAKGASFYR